jgi:uncharacterized protein (DUF952 family)
MVRAVPVRFVFMDDHPARPGRVLRLGDPERKQQIRVPARDFSWTCPAAPKCPPRYRFSYGAPAKLVCVGRHTPGGICPTRYIFVRCRKMQAGPIYHMCKREEWEAGRAAGRYTGSTQDQDDGFIHFSTAAQIIESAAKHRTGQRDLVLIEVDSAALGDTLRWERSRGGGLFPHLHGALPLGAVRRVAPLPLDAHGRHVFPWGLGG